MILTARVASHLMLLLLLLWTLPARAADWPQFRGPNTDGSTPESILTSWPSEGPKVLWKIPLGESFGSFAVSQGKAYCFVERDKKEFCIALDANTGKEVWAAEIDRTIFENQGGNGPRSTPAVAGNFVYVLGTYLKLVCLRSSDGGIVWQHDLAAEFDGQLGTRGIKQWGNAASPLVDGNLVFVCGGGPGQALMAFDRTTGKLVWKGQDDKLTHASPTAATILGARQIIFFTQSGLVSVVPETGNVMWRYAFPWSTSTAASPIVGGEIVYCSAGYGVGAGAVRISKSEEGYVATEIWRTQGQLMNHWTSAVCRDGFLYGLYGFKEYNRMPLKCIELATGKERWSKPGFGQGGLILVGKHVLVQGDQGQLVLAEATPEDYKELARAQPLGGKCWTMPVVSGGRIYTRSNKEGVCLEVLPK